MARITSVRLQDELSERLDALATSLDRPKAWIIEQAIRSYVDEQSWQVKAIEDALKDYQSGRVPVVPHEVVMERLEEKIKAKLGQ